MREIKGKRRIKFERKQDTGITLIALVITIIVLLILAGVTIATLTRDNGIFAKSSEAKVKSEIASVKEQAQLDISNYVAEKLEIGEDSTVNTPEKVQEILDMANENNENKYYAGYTQTGVKTPSGHEVPYEELYTAEGVTDVSISNYGDKVDYVSKGDSSLIWRIFYDDEDYVYLISSSTDGGNTIQECVLQNFISNYNGSADIKDDLLKSLNSHWFTALGENPVSNDNAKAVAYLMNQEVWKDYKDSEGKASYAIGGPTLELFVNSYNATAEEEGRGDKINISAYESAGYSQQSGTWIYREYNNGIYNNGADYWLTSPRKNTGATGIFYIQSEINLLNDKEITAENIGLRPVVIIPKSKFQYNILPEDE